ncbi:MAG: GNAT family N-acetyltransferase [Marmoricola sp.]
MTGRPDADVSCRVGWADDAAGIAAVQVRAWRSSYATLLPASLLESMEVEELTAHWRKALTAPADARQRVLVALERHRVTGFVLTAPATDPDLDPVAVGELSDLTVDPDDQRHGHGSRLMQAGVDTLRADRFTRAVTWLPTTADAQRRFWTDAGWEPDGAHRTLDLTGDGNTVVRQIRLHTALA